MKGKLIKRFVWVMAAVFAITGMAGACGNSDTSSGSSTGSGEEESSGDVSGQGSETGEITKLTVGIIVPSTESEDLDEVEAAINEITREEIQAEIEFVTVTTSNHQQQYNLMLSSGEKLDLLVGYRETYLSAYNSNQLAELDEAIAEHGQDITAAMGDLMQVGVVNGKQYMVPINKGYAADMGVFLRKDILDKYDLDVSDADSYEDLTEILTVVHENEPQLMTMAPMYSNGEWFSFYNGVDNLGDNMGVLMDKGQSSTEVVNLFETDYYRDFCNMMRQWNQAGFISQDAAFSDECGVPLFKTGKAFAFIYILNPGYQTSLKQNTGYDWEFVKITDAHMFTNSVATLLWCVPIQCVDVNKAVQFLNLCYTSADIMNLLNWGIEGQHYVKNEDGTIGYPEGVDGTNCGYVNSLNWQFPNQFLTYVWEGNDPDIWDQAKAANDRAVKSKALGFNFDSSQISTAFASCQSVLAEYRGILETGCVDIDETLEKFNADLYEAGLQEIIDEKQEQLDEFLAAIGE